MAHARNTAEKFWNTTDRSTECWIWIGTLMHRGYGVTRLDGHKKYYRAHRLAWILSKGEIPQSLFVCHKCDNPRCINPDHLFLGTHTDNMRDMARKGRKVTLRGENSLSAKLSADDVRNIRKLREAGATYASLAEIYGVSVGNIGNIVTGKTWAHQLELPAERQEAA